MKYLGKKPEVVVAKPGQLPEAPPGLLVVMPALWEYLTADKWEDGKTRQPSAVSLFCEEGRVKLAMNDKAMKRSCYVTADTLEEALHALERMLAAGDADWRTWKK